jgi:hypothetical protein
MSDSIDNLDITFTWTDVEQWVKQGLIAPYQAIAILQQVEEADSSLPTPQGPASQLPVPQEPAPQAPAAPEPRERRLGLNLVTIAYYFGSFMILLAYTFFMGLHWQNMSYAMQLAVSGLTVGFLWSVGIMLRRYGSSLPGGLLIFAGTAIIPLVAYTLAQTLGIWPQTPGYDDPSYYNFYETVRPYWVYLEVVSLLVAVIVLVLTRFPLVTMLIAFWGWYLSMDLARGTEQSGYPGYSDREQIVSIVVGVVMLLAGVLLQGRTRQDYSRWLYIAGQLVLLANLSALTYEKEGVLGLVYIAIYVGFVVASVWLQRPVFLVFGALGCYGYISYLAFKTFSGAEGFPIALALVGLLIVLTAVAYQKYVRTWLEEHLGKRSLSAQEAA